MSDSLKELAFRANMDLASSGLVMGTFGNVSAIDRAAGVFAIKPSGVAYDRLTPAHMVLVSLETGAVVQVPLDASALGYLDPLFVLPAVAALAAAAIVSAVLAWKRPHLLDELKFFYRLWRAHRQANRFYADYPWVTKNIAYHPGMPRRLDVYRPEQGTGHPVIVCHGPAQAVQPMRQQRQRRLPLSETYVSLTCTCSHLPPGLKIGYGEISRWHLPALYRTILRLSFLKRKADGQ